MPPFVKNITLKRFRSIPSEKVELDNPTFFVGRNGSGKTNFADAFAFLGEAMVVPLQAVFNSRGGISSVRNRTSGRSYPPNLGLGVTLEKLGRLGGGPELVTAHYGFEITASADYGFEVIREQCMIYDAKGEKYWFDRQNQNISSNIEVLKVPRPGWISPNALSMPLIGGILPFLSVHRILKSMRTYSIDPNKLREMQDPDSGESLRTDGSNAASVLEEVSKRSKEAFTRIGQILETIVPNIKSIRQVKHGKKQSLEFTQEWGARKKLNFEAFSMSDGTLRALGLLLAIYQRQTPTVLVIEEPEASMHPGAAGVILDLLRHASRQMQVVVTTHSPEILNADWIEDRHLRMVTWKEGATEITQIPEAAKLALQKHLTEAGELLRSDMLDSSMGVSRTPQGHLFV